VSALAFVARVPLGVINQAHIVAFGGRLFVFGNAVVAVVTFIVVLHNAAFANVFAQVTLERSFVSALFLLLSVGVLGFRSLEFAKLLQPPHRGYVLLVIERINSARNVSAQGAGIAPERADLVEEIKAVIGEEIGRLGEVFYRRREGTVNGIEGIIGSASVGDYSIRFDLGIFSSKP
jgi:hypothetical protein